jgi:ribonuclease HI
LVRWLLQSEPKNPGGHAAWGALVKIGGKDVYAQGGYCGVGPSMSNNVAEFAAFIAVAEECLKHPGVILIRGDSKLVVMLLNGKWKSHGGFYKPYYDKAKILWSQLKSRAKLEWVSRVENSVCDYLSKQVLKDRGVVFKIQPEG